MCFHAADGHGRGEIELCHSKPDHIMDSWCGVGIEPKSSSTAVGCIQNRQHARLGASTLRHPHDRNHGARYGTAHGFPKRAKRPPLLLSPPPSGSQTTQSLALPGLAGLSPSLGKQTNHLLCLRVSYLQSVAGTSCKRRRERFQLCVSVHPVRRAPRCSPSSLLLSDTYQS
jgi:hypothetical protein